MRKRRETPVLHADGTQSCVSCSLRQEVEKFKRRSDGTRFSMCNRCLYVRYTRPSAAKKTKQVQDYKVTAGCIDCGFDKHPAALEFDHRPGENKSFNVMEKVGCYSMDRIWAEIEKCEVVCANCHAIRTAERRVLV